MTVRQSRSSAPPTRNIMPRRVNSGRRASRGESRVAATISTYATATRKQRCQQQQQPQSCQRSEQRADLGQQPRARRTSAARPLRMSEWLRELLDSGEVSGLEWENRKAKIFTISWVHKSNHSFDQAQHSHIFSRYAEYRRQPASNFSTQKASFRCALNSLKDVEQLTKNDAKRGAEARRTFRFLSPSDPKYGRNRMKNKMAGACKGRKRRPGSVRHRRPSSSSWSSALESASPRPASSPLPSESSSSCSNSPVRTFQAVDASSVPGGMEVDCEAPSRPPQASWTTSYLQPIGDGQINPALLPAQDQSPRMEFMVKSDGITEVVSREGYRPEIKRSPPASPLTEFKVSLQTGVPSGTASTRVQVDRDIQSGGIVTGLPNFSELGVSDTYSPEEVFTNTKLACGGEVKVREGKSFALPIPINLDQFCQRPLPISQRPAGDYQETQVSVSTSIAFSQEIRPVQQMKSSCSFSPQTSTSFPVSVQTASTPQLTFSSHQLVELHQSDLDIGQTLEISESLDQCGPASTYHIFTPQDDGENVPTQQFSHNQTGEGQDQGTSMVTTAYCNALATILGPNVDPYNVSGQQTIPEEFSSQSAQVVEEKLVEEQVVEAAVVTQIIQPPEMLPPLLDTLQSEEFPDLFLLGAI